MRQDMTAACLLGLDLHCQMFGVGPRRGIHTSILRAACGPPLSPLTDRRTGFYPLLWAACASIKVPSCLPSRFSDGINCSDLGWRLAASLILFFFSRSDVRPSFFFHLRHVKGTVVHQLVNLHPFAGRVSRRRRARISVRLCHNLA